MPTLNDGGSLGSPSFQSAEASGQNRQGDWREACRHWPSLLLLSQMLVVEESPFPVLVATADPSSRKPPLLTLEERLWRGQPQSGTWETADCRVGSHSVDLIEGKRVGPPKGGGRSVSNPLPDYRP